MTNAKNELLETLKNNEMLCAEISNGDSWEEDRKHFRLKINYSTTDLNAFLKSLDFTYDSGFGGQELYGIVWLKDGTWLERGEYDGSEWWEHKVLPDVPEALK